MDRTTARIVDEKNRQDTLRNPIVGFNVNSSTVVNPPPATTDPEALTECMLAASALMELTEDDFEDAVIDETASSSDPGNPDTNGDGFPDDPLAGTTVENAIIKVRALDDSCIPFNFLNGLRDTHITFGVADGLMQEPFCMMLDDIYSFLSRQYIWTGLSVELEQYEIEGFIPVFGQPTWIMRAKIVPDPNPVYPRGYRIDPISMSAGWTIAIWQSIPRILYELMEVEST